MSSDAQEYDFEGHVYEHDRMVPKSLNRNENEKGSDYEIITENTKEITSIFQRMETFFSEPYYAYVDLRMKKNKT